MCSNVVYYHYKLIWSYTFVHFFYSHLVVKIFLNEESIML